MATEVKMPDLGEGVEDATISRWLVKEGDEVNAGDVILEVATDKVDTEVPAPAAGKILKLHVSEGEIVSLSKVLAIIGAEGEGADSNGAGNDEAAATQPADEEESEATAVPTDAAEPAPDQAEPASEEGVKATPVAKRVAAEKGLSLSGISPTGPGGQITKEDVLARAKTPPAAEETLPAEAANIAPLEVRRIAADHNIGLSEVAQGRPVGTLTRYDVLAAVAKRDGTAAPAADEQYLAPQGFRHGKAAADSPAASESAAAKPAEAKPAVDKSAPPSEAAPSRAPAAQPAAQAGAGQELVKPNRMRQLIAKNTFESLQSSPQLTTCHDVDMTAVINHRKAHKAEFAAQGVNLTITAYLIAATIEGLKAVPAANARWTDEGIVIYRYYNIGMAASMPADKYGLGGLIVPVIKQAGDLNLVGLARQVNTLAEKAKTNKIAGPDLQDGTFTVTNYGTSGSVFQTPIIHQGQAGILGTGAIEKRPVVVSNGSPLEANLGDYLTFKPMMTLALTFDHRVLDGATADAFCVAVKKTLEQWP